MSTFFLHFSSFSIHTGGKLTLLYEFYNFKLLFYFVTSTVESLILINKKLTERLKKSSQKRSYIILNSIISTQILSNYIPPNIFHKLKSIFLADIKIRSTLINYTFSFSKSDRIFNLQKWFCHFLDVDSIFEDLMIFSDDNRGRWRPRQNATLLFELWDDQNGYFMILISTVYDFNSHIDVFILMIQSLISN
jgi:hypothetical protein